MRDLDFCLVPDGTERTYDPRRQQGVSVFHEEMRSLSEGDRIQFTASANGLKVANRELGTVESIGDGRLHLKMDGSRTVGLDPNKHLRLDYGYAVTGHSSQDQTADRVLIHADTELAAKDLLNSRMAYVATSRGAHDARIFTNNAAALGSDLSSYIQRIVWLLAADGLETDLYILLLRLR